MTFRFRGHNDLLNEHATTEKMAHESQFCNLTPFKEAVLANYTEKGIGENSKTMRQVKNICQEV